MADRPAVPLLARREIRNNHLFLREEQVRAYAFPEFAYSACAVIDVMTSLSRTTLSWRNIHIPTLRSKSWPG
jgi:hypothetical protein